STAAEGSKWQRGGQAAQYLPARERFRSHLAQIATRPAHGMSPAGRLIMIFKSSASARCSDDLWFQRPLQSLAQDPYRATSRRRRRASRPRAQTRVRGTMRRRDCRNWSRARRAYHHCPVRQAGRAIGTGAIEEADRVYALIDKRDAHRLAARERV